MRCSARVFGPRLREGSIYRTDETDEAGGDEVVEFEDNGDEVCWRAIPLEEDGGG